MKKTGLTFLAFICLFSCKKNTQEKNVQILPVNDPEETVNQRHTDTVIAMEEEEKEPVSLEELHDTLFINIKDYSGDFVYDIKYATEDNFLKAAVYDCPECFLRVSAAKALIEVNQEFISKGYKIKFFDCYRPHDVQKKMWKIMPNRIYVADPAKGSIHNKGGAVDITLVDMEGNELNMGTHYDYFGREAHHAYQGHTDEVLNNRKLLKETMEKYGFGSITSEWWHYNHKATVGNRVANFKWACDQ